MRGVFVVLAMGLSVTGCDRRDKQESAPAVRAVRAVTPSADEILEAAARRSARSMRCGPP